MDKAALISNLLSGSLTLSGLLMVFSGFLFAQAASFPSSTPDETIDRFRSAGKFAIAPFLLALIIAGMCLGWMLTQNDLLFIFCWVASFLLLIGTGAYGAFVILKYL
jgi:hypothetical protein